MATDRRASMTESSLEKSSAYDGHGSDARVKEGKQVVRHDEFDVYGDEETAEIKYRTMVWWKAAALMLAETVSLGILSIPSVFASLGMVAGCILVIGLGCVATITGYLLGMFKLRHPHVHNMSDAGMVLFGPIGREILGASQIIFLVFSCGGHCLTGMIAFDTITSGASCSVLWAGITALVCLLLTLPRTLNGISYLSVASFVSVLVAVLITMTGVGVAGHKGTVITKTDLTFASGFTAVTDIDTSPFFTFISEMRKPEDFPKALYFLQIADTTLYLVVGVVVYAYTGQYTVSPALGNTGTTLRKIAYGIVLPTIMIAAVINGHVSAKLIFLRIFRRDGKTSRHLTTHTWTGWLTWTGICLAIWAVAFVIAELIPFFDDLLGVMSSLFASWFTYGISEIFYFHLTPRSEWWSTRWQKTKSVFWAFIILAGAFIMVGGLYASIDSIVQGYRDGSYSHPFSCVSHALTS